MKIAYLTSCFATASHTFIRREVIALRALGIDIELYGIRRDSPGCEEAKTFAFETNYLYPVSFKDLLVCNFQQLAKRPASYIKQILAAFLGKEFGFKRRLKMVYHCLAASVMARHMKRSGVTHVHAHFLNVSSSIAMFAAGHLGIPYSITVHSAGTYKTPHMLGMNQKLRQAQFLMMISHNNVRYFDAIEPCREKSHVVRCGLDLEGFEYGSNNEQKNFKEPLAILCVGRFVEKKGFIYVIEAMASLELPAHLTIVGYGPLERELKHRVVELDLEGTVTFAGKRDASGVKEAMAQADVLVVPSVTSASGEMEGLPVVIMEAMAQGLLVVAAQHSGIPEIVQDGKTGWLAPEREIKALAEAILNAAKSDVALVRRQARQLIEGEYNIATIAQTRKELFIQHHQGA